MHGRERRRAAACYPQGHSGHAAADISAWLFGGWGLDARIGRITREHGDVEFWVERIHAERSKAALVEAGATALDDSASSGGLRVHLGRCPFSTAYFDRRPDGSFSQPRGRLSDWLFPPGSFGDEPGTLDGTPVLAMSVSCMLAMKEQFPHLRNGRPWRQKDIADIEILRDWPPRRGPGNESRPSACLAGLECGDLSRDQLAARCRGRPSVVNASVTGPSGGQHPYQQGRSGPKNLPRGRAPFHGVLQRLLGGLVEGQLEQPLRVGGLHLRCGAGA